MSFEYIIDEFIIITNNGKMVANAIEIMSLEGDIKIKVFNYIISFRKEIEKLFKDVDLTFDEVVI